MTLWQYLTAPVDDLEQVLIVAVVAVLAGCFMLGWATYLSRRDRQRKDQTIGVDQIRTERLAQIRSEQARRIHALKDRP